MINPPVPNRQAVLRQVHRVWPLLLDNVVFASTAKAPTAFSSPSSLSVHCSAAMHAVAAGRLAALRSLFEPCCPYT